MKRALVVVPLFLALVVVLPAAPAHACSCAMLSSAQKVENADVVVRGTITGLDDPGGLDSGHLVTWEVAVAEVYRGAAAATTFVRSASDGASCGIEVQEGASTCSSPGRSVATCGPGCVTAPRPPPPSWSPRSSTSPAPGALHRAGPQPRP